MKPGLGSGHRPQQRVQVLIVSTVSF